MVRIASPRGEALIVMPVGTDPSVGPGDTNPLPTTPWSRALSKRQTQQEAELSGRGAGCFDAGQRAGHTDERAGG